MYYKGKPKHSKPGGNLVPTRHKLTAVAAVWITAALTVVAALGASARNALVNDPDFKAASDMVQAQIREYKSATPSAARKTGSSPASKGSEIPVVAAPKGVDEGNWFIAQGSSGSGSSGGGAIYDPLRRIVKIVETRAGSVTSTKQFVWAGDQLCEERDASGAVTRKFFNQGEQISGTNYYYTRDHNSSVREMTNGAGAVQSQYGYGPWGEVSKLAGTGPDSDFQYAGMYMHQPSRLNLAVNRAYSASQGRFISRDPMDDQTFAMGPQSPEPVNPDPMALASQSNLMAMAPVLGASNDAMVQAHLMKMMPPSEQTNPYVYATNNPINVTDRSGLGPANDIGNWVNSKIPNPYKWWKKWCWCRDGCRVTQDFVYNSCVQSGKSPILCKALADGAYHSCVAGCMANPDTPSP